MIFETHAHYDDEAFDGDRDELLCSMAETGIGTVINVCAAPQSLEATRRLMERYPFVYGAFGIHPDEVGALDDSLLERIRALCALEKAVAVGEIGLDYYWDKENHGRQILWFERQMDLARACGLPLIIHSREAAADTLAAMKRAGAGEMGGVIHCFSYAKEMAREFLEMGFYLGIGGVVTFKNARKLKEAVAYAPLERLLLETDSPYLAPVPNRGKRNSSRNLPYIAEGIAQIKGVTAEEVIETTEQNAKRLFLGD